MNSPFAAIRLIFWTLESEPAILFPRRCWRVYVSIISSLSSFEFCLFQEYKLVANLTTPVVFKHPFPVEMCLADIMRWDIWCVSKNEDGDFFKKIFIINYVAVFWLLVIWFYYYDYFLSVRVSKIQNAWRQFGWVP